MKAAKELEGTQVFFLHFRRDSGQQKRLLNAPEIAIVYVGLGEKDQAMAWLKKGYAERFSPWVLMRPCFDPLRSDLNFQDLVRRVGLPQL